MPDGFAPAGTLAVALRLDPAGVVQEVAIRNGTLRGAAAFRGRPGASVPALAGSLFALCGHAQSVASAAAIAAAGGRADCQADNTPRLAAERIAGLLRSAVLDWPGPPMALPLLPLRHALAAAARLQQGEADIAALADALAALAPWFDAVARQAAAAPGFADVATSPLRPEDDAAVIAALRADPRGFPRAPALPGRRIETGLGGIGLAGRLTARRAALAETLALLRGGRAEPGRLRSGSPAPGEGWAAVETARGRLHHWVRLDAEGWVADYAILAPTDWNFAPAGPLAATLRGARPGEDAVLWAARLAAAFDPCLAVRVTVDA